MDLLGSILGSMEKPPSASEKEKKMAKAYKKEKEIAEKKSRKEREAYKQELDSKIKKFIDDPKARRLKLPPTSKTNRALAHEIAEMSGLISYSFGTEEYDRHMILFKKEHPPSEEELQALRNGEVYDPSKGKTPTSPTATSLTTAPRRTTETQGPSYGDTPHYQHKYKHLLGGLDCAEKTAVKMEPNRAFGYVPSSNKKDLRSIEQTLNDMKNRKRPKVDDIDTVESDSLELATRKKTKHSS